MAGESELSCHHCGTRDFMHHENEPGQPTKLECSACRRPVHVNITSFCSRIRTWEPSTYGMIGAYGGMKLSPRITDTARYDLIAQGARFFHFLEFLAAVELNFVEGLYFVTDDGRLFAVMAYSEADAKRQVFTARFMERLGWLR